MRSARTRAGRSPRFAPPGFGSTRLDPAAHGVERPRPAAPRYGEDGEEGIQLPGVPEEELAAAQHGGRRDNGYWSWHACSGIW